MSKVYGRVLEEWGRLLTAVQESEAEFPALAAYKATLEGHLENVTATRARQLALREESQEATRKLQQWIAAGKDDVRRLRSRAQAELGPRDTRLRLFGIKPL